MMCPEQVALRAVTLRIAQALAHQGFSEYDVLIAKSGAGTLAAAVAGCTGAVAGSSGAVDGSPAAAAGSDAAVAGSSGAADVRLGAVADVVPDTLASGKRSRSVLQIAAPRNSIFGEGPRGPVEVGQRSPPWCRCGRIHRVRPHTRTNDRSSSSLQLLSDLAVAQRRESPARVRAQGSPVNMLAQGSPGRRVGSGSPGRTVAQESPAYTPVAQHRTH